MSRDRILINKNLIPYTFQILLENKWYTFDINYNSSADLFTVALACEGEVLTAGEPIIYGKPLFNDILHKKNVPAVMIIPVDEAGNTNKVTWNNFNDSVFLCLFNTADTMIYYSTKDNIKDNEITLFKNSVNYETASPETRHYMENIIISKGGVVNKSGDIPTLDELMLAIRSIGGVYNGK